MKNSFDHPPDPLPGQEGGKVYLGDTPRPPSKRLRLSALPLFPQPGRGLRPRLGWVMKSSYDHPPGPLPGQEGGEKYICPDVFGTDPRPFGFTQGRLRCFAPLDSPLYAGLHLASAIIISWACGSKQTCLPSKVPAAPGCPLQPRGCHWPQAIGCRKLPCSLRRQQG